MTTIKADVIADSASDLGGRLTTLQLRYPRWIHAEFMTHRVFSRNASSSRAVPVKRLIDDVLTNPAVPIFWGKNQRGMQADGEHDALVADPFYSNLNDNPDQTELLTKHKAYLEAMDYAVEVAKAFDLAGYHKQLVNRLLEPFSHINVVVTSTYWANFFALRRHADAEPHIRILADEIFQAIGRSNPDRLERGEWHLPYVSRDGVDWTDTDVVQNLVKSSVARCARVSYLTTDARDPTLEQDLSLYERLVGSQPLHASPAEHQATPNVFINRSGVDASPAEHPWWSLTFNGMIPDSLHGNFRRGWVQYRKTLPHEVVEDGYAAHQTEVIDQAPETGT